MKAPAGFQLTATNAKVNPPLPGPAQLKRQRLVDTALVNKSARLVLLRAAAGFGKTNAMLQYRSELELRGARTAWLTLDRADNDISRFLQCLSLSLLEILPEPADDSDMDPGVLLQRIGKLEQQEGAFALFLDDYEVIKEPGVHGLVHQIVDCMPRKGQVVIGTRTLPNLGLGRLRARGQLIEIEAEQLRFSLTETAEYLVGCRGIELMPLDIEHLHRKTEGWVAGLWLVSATLARRCSMDVVTRFSGSSQEVAEYLSEDVLNGQSEDVRTFLLHTSILRTLTPSLCQALIPGLDCEAMLRQLETENVLLTRIDGEERSYRYHSLFGGFLRAHLAREQPQNLRKLQLAASLAYETKGRPVPAIEHAMEAGDTDRVIQLLDTHGGGLLSAGRMRLLTRWFDALPEGALSSDPRLRMMQAWALCFTRGPREAMDLLERCGLDDSSEPSLRPHLLAIQPVLLSMMDRPEEAYRLGMASLPHMPIGDPFADGALLAVLADMCSAKDQPGEALRMLDMLRNMESGKVGRINDMHSQAAEGTIAMFEGRLREATTRFRIAVSAHDTNNASFTNGNAWAGTFYAAALYEENRLDEATALLRAYLPLAREAGMPDHLILGYRILARMAFASGDVDQTFHLLAELETIGYERQLPRVVASARLERSRTQLLQGHVLPARDELARASDPITWAPFASLLLPASDIEDPVLGGLRWRIFCDDAQAAAAAIEFQRQAAIQARRYHRALKLGLLQALALHRANEHAEALERLDETLRECWAEGFMRLMLDEGLPMGLLVSDVFDRLRARSRDEQAGPYLIWLQRLLQAFGPLPRDAEPSSARPVDAYLADPLTPKEAKVLQLLAEGYSNKAIAEKLLIAVSTVRTHLREINSKLGVNSRLQAVAAGRALGLLR